MSDSEEQIPDYGAAPAFQDDEEGGVPADPEPVERDGEGSRAHDAEDGDDDDEGEGEGLEQDSSEEEDEDDPEEARRIAEGFIADEEEDDEEERRRLRRERRKERRKRKQEEEEEGLDEDDLELLEENTGQRIERPEKHRLKRLRRHRSDSDSQVEAETIRPVRTDLEHIFDDEENISDVRRRGDGMLGDEELSDSGLPTDAAAAASGAIKQLAEPARRRGGYDAGAPVVDEDDLDDFIEEDDLEEEEEGIDEEERERKKEERRRLRLEQRRKRPELQGVAADAWDEVEGIFGNGEDYDWALEVDDEEVEVEPKRMEYKDIFEPAQIKERLLTEADELIKQQDIPERFQLAMPGDDGLRLLETKVEGELLDAAVSWVAPRISDRTWRLFLAERSEQNPMGAELVQLRPRFLSAVRDVLGFIMNESLEVPFIWVHRRDFVTCIDTSPNGGRRIRRDLLNRSEVWRVQDLSMKWRALQDRKADIERTWERMHARPTTAATNADGNDGEEGEAPQHSSLNGPASSFRDEFFEMMKAKVENVEEVSDLVEWLGMHYPERLKDAQALAASESGQFIDADEELHADGIPVDGVNGRKQKSTYKRPTVVSQYERAKASLANEFAKNFGISASELAVNFTSRNKQYFPDDQAVPPDVYSQGFAMEGTDVPKPEIALRWAKIILIEEIGRNPLLKKEVRQLFKMHAVISVEPTEKGMTKIDELHPYYTFKYLREKPAHQLLNSSQYLAILAAEAEHLVTVKVSIPGPQSNSFTHELYESYCSDNVSDVAKAWNEQRREILEAAFQTLLVPTGMRWLREWLRDENEDWLARRCGEELFRRVNLAPFRTGEMDKGEIPNVLAVTWGNGDMRRDDICTVFVDDDGRVREHRKFQSFNARPPVVEDERSRRKAEQMDDRAEFLKLLESRKPDVVVVGGFNIKTLHLENAVRGLVDEYNMRMYTEAQLTAQDNNEEPPDRTKMQVPIVYMYDDVARIFQNSRRAEEEFPELKPLFRYAIGLARYAQSPLQEFAALGKDLTAIRYDKDQKFLPKDKLEQALERALVNVTNDVGVDINRAASNTYYQHLLQYVSGLGPRKAQSFITLIHRHGGTLICREDLVRENITTAAIFMNVAAFLRIPQEILDKLPEDSPVDPLDDTRIHLEDYAFARKIAADALELDEEDMINKHRSQVVLDFINEEDRANKLSELNLDDYGDVLEGAGLRKRLTLDLCKGELLYPFVDKRDDFRPLSAEEKFTMITGEAPNTLRKGFIIPVVVTGADRTVLYVRTGSGIEGKINTVYLTDDGYNNPQDMYRKGQLIQGVVLDVNRETFSIELSHRPMDLQHGDLHVRAVPLDPYFDRGRAEKDRGDATRRQKSKEARAARVVKHPNWRPFKSGQAEEHLANQPRGDVVIRPSSKGNNHLAVTWKVADGVYQHIDVLELDKPSEYALGRVLRVAGKYSYSDLDELIVSHINAMARKVEEMMNHEKYKGSTEQELHKYLTNYSLANPTKSNYAFGLDRKHPGYFLLCFKANKDGAIQTWPVKVIPGAFQLFETEIPDVPNLCNAFKMRYMAQFHATADHAALRQV